MDTFYIQEYLTLMHSWFSKQENARNALLQNVTLISKNVYRFLQNYCCSRWGLRYRAMKTNNTNPIQTINLI